MKNLLKKTLVFLGLIGIISASLAALTPVQTSATQIDSRSNGSCQFLGFVCWDDGLSGKSIDNETDLQNNIWVIAANVATDITVLAAYLVLGYVIYGGYLYTFSGGDPSKVATGKKALSQAFIGLAIVMLAYVIMSSIRVALGGGKLACDPNTGTDCIKVDTAPAVISSAISWVIGIAGVISAIFVVYGGISYTTSAGDPGKLQKAKSMITYALIGLAIVALAEIITAFVTGIIKDANTSTSAIERKTSLVEPKNIILKETINEKIS